MEALMYTVPCQPPEWDKDEKNFFLSKNAFSVDSQSLLSCHQSHCSAVCKSNLQLQINTNNAKFKKGHTLRKPVSIPFSKLQIPTSIPTSIACSKRCFSVKYCLYGSLVPRPLPYYI